MRKVIAFTHVTLDGYVSGEGGELDWANAGDKVYADVEPRMRQIGAAVYGRVTYDMMASYWPTVPSDPNSSAEDRAHAAWVEAIPKVVVSRSLARADWNNTTLIRDDVAEQVTALKGQPGGDLMIFGSPRLIHLFARQGLVDEYLMYVNPVVLGAGVPLFEAGSRANLRWLEARPLDVSVVRLRYALVRA